MKASVSVVFVAVLPVAGSAAAAPSPPQAFLGAWDASAAACASDPGEGRLEILAGQMRFYGREGPIEAVTVKGPREVSIASRLSEEGESWTDITTYRLSADGRSLTDVSVPSEPHPKVRVRCPPR